MTELEEKEREKDRLRSKIKKEGDKVDKILVEKANDEIKLDVPDMLRPFYVDISDEKRKSCNECAACLNTDEPNCIICSELRPCKRKCCFNPIPDIKKERNTSKITMQHVEDKIRYVHRKSDLNL